MIKNLLIGVGVIGALVLGLFGVNKPAQVIVQKEPVVTAGAVSSPDILSPYFSFGGVRQWAGHVDMRQASSTLCSIQAPLATSTLDVFTVDFDSTTSFATSYMLGYGTINATTTSLIANANLSIAANALGTSVSSSTRVIIPPGVYLNLNYSTSTGANVAGSGYAPTGTCNAIFQEVN